jgi:hypothetical protein
MPTKAFFPVILGLLTSASLAAAQEAAPPPPAYAPQPAPIPPPYVASDEYPEPSSIKVGFYGTLLGPNALLGAGLAIQPSRMFEASLWYGNRSTTASENTGLATASATIKLNTLMARGRLWLGGRHSLVVEVGAGVSSYSVSATGSNIAHDSLTYTRKGAPPVAMLGLAYGFRTAGGFRLTVGGGAIVHGSKLGDSTVTSAGNFSASDRDSLRSSLDTTVDSLTDTRPYLDLSIGYMF